MFVKLKDLFQNMPLWFVNLISILSGLITIISGAIALVSLFNITYEEDNFKFSCKMIILALCCFIIFLFFQLRKYRNYSFNHLKTTSFNYHKFLHESRDLYFDTMKEHKLGNQNIQSLARAYKDKLTFMLDNLCNILQEYTGQEINACIKLISYTDKEEIINISDTLLFTFCRSKNCSTNRGSYEEQNQIRLCENTDFLNIIDNINGYNKGYFYKTNLKKYAYELRKEGKKYKNSNPNWDEEYIGTIVVPIQIKFNKLYHQKSNKNTHIIGFICVDSKSDNAFLLKQEVFNVDIVKSFADNIYILLGQYQHYLKKIKNIA